MKAIGVLRAQQLETPDGNFIILADDSDRVISSGWTNSLEEIIGRLPAGLKPSDIQWGEIEASRAVEAYYEGDMEKIMQVPVLQWGTEMQKIGWQKLREISPGNPLSYTEFAAAIGNPNAVRAAASICARNAPALFVPCHRVLRSDGSLGGFAWGTDVKRSLLNRESSGSYQPTLI